MDNHEELKKYAGSSRKKGNQRYITISSNQPEQWEPIIEAVKINYVWWAYIFHDKDDTEKHLHILAYDGKRGTSIKAHANRFEGIIPPNFVCSVRNPRAMARYLIHKDSPTKHQYDESEVFTNSLDKYRTFFEEYKADVMEEFNDFAKVRIGTMSPTEFIEKYKLQIYELPFQSKISVYHKVFSIPDAKSMVNNNNNKGVKHEG